MKTQPSTGSLFTALKSGSLSLSLSTSYDPAKLQPGSALWRQVNTDLLYSVFVETKPALHCRRPQPCVGGSLAVPLPKPVRGLGRDSLAQVSSKDAQTRGRDAGKDSIKVWKGLESTEQLRGKGCYVSVRNCPYQTHKTRPGPAAQMTGNQSCATWLAVPPQKVLLLLRQDFCLPSYSTKASRSQTKAVVAGKQWKQGRQLTPASKAMSGGVKSSVWPHPHSNTSNMNTAAFSANAETWSILQTNIPQGRKNPKMHQVRLTGQLLSLLGSQALAYF